MNHSDKLDEIAPALVAAARKLRNPKVDTKGQVRGKADYMYLGLPALLESVRDAYRELGLTFAQEVTGQDGGITITTRVMHLSGQWIDFGPTFIPAQGGPQDYGSAITYGRRYSLAAAVGLAAEEDDDGARVSVGTGKGIRDERLRGKEQPTGGASSTVPAISGARAATAAQPDGQLEHRAPAPDPSSPAGGEAEVSPSDVPAGEDSLSVAGSESSPASGHVHEWKPVARPNLAAKGFVHCEICGKTMGPGEAA